MDDLLEGLSNISTRLNKFESRGRKWEKYPYPGKGKAPNQNSKTHNSNGYTNYSKERKGKPRVSFSNSRHSSREGGQSRSNSQRTSRASYQHGSRPSSRHNLFFWISAV